MCLQTKQREPKIAEEDIIVYKLLVETNKENELKSPYTEFFYTTGEEYTTEIKPSNDDSYLDNEASYYQQEDDRDEYYGIGEGFHSAISAKRLSRLIQWKSKVYECIIPKGSEYYIGFSDLLVSNKIIVTGEEINV